MSVYNFPPGPRRNLLYMIATRKYRAGDPITFFTDLVAQYGCIVHYMAMNNHIVFINDPDLIAEVLLTQHRIFTKERTQQRMKILVGEGLITSEGRYHQQQRHLSQPAFHRQRIAKYAESMVELAARTREEWTRLGSAPVDIALEMMHLSLAIVGKTLFDTEIDAEVQGVASAVNEIMRLYNFLVLLPKAEHLLDYPIPGLLRFRRARARIDATVDRMVREHRESGVDRGDLLSMLLAARYEDGSAMTNEQVRDEVITIFLAGYETTANALTWTWYLLSQNPEAEGRMHAEIDSVLGGRLPTMEDLQRLKDVERVATEAMRLYPPAWAMGRKATEDFDLAGYHLPRGTSVFMSQYIMGRNPEYFPEPERFEPERFLPEQKAARPRFAYFPFGGGSRQCIGESFAWAELVLVLATIAQKWKLTLEPGHVVEPQPLITLRPKFGMKMRLQPR